MNFFFPPKSRLELFFHESGMLLKSKLRIFSMHASDEEKLDALLQNVGILKFTRVDPCLLEKTKPSTKFPIY